MFPCVEVTVQQVKGVSCLRHSVHGYTVILFTSVIWVTSWSSYNM